MAEPIVPVTAAIPQTNILSQMPSPHSRNSLCFWGKDINGFLSEYKCATSQANLTDEVKCEEIWIYFMRKEKWVLDILKGYVMLNWNNLKGQLRSLYTSSVVRRIYQPQGISISLQKRKRFWKRFILILIHTDKISWSSLLVLRPKMLYLHMIMMITFGQE